MKHHLTAALPGVTALALLEPAAARGLSFTKKDMKTEEALWRLYDRWGKRGSRTKSCAASQPSTSPCIFERQAKLLQAVRRRGGNYNATLSSLPDSVDWRDKTCQGQPCLGPVRDQGTCGSCWAFAATGTTESNRAIAANDILPHLSVQELLDCDRTSNRCKGGHAVNAFRYGTQ